MTLEERIKQMLEESTKQVTPEVVAEEIVEETTSLTEEELDEMTQEEFDAIDEEQLDELSKKTLKSYIKKADRQNSNMDVDDQAGFNKYMKRSDNIDRAEEKLNPKRKTESAEVSSQVAALLEAEGLSEEFKMQAVTIFEAAVTDRVLQIQEEMEAEYNEKLDEAKAELETNIDGFLNEAVQEWADNNEVAIESNFKMRLAESFMDGLQSLLAEHNIDLPDESEDALEIALDEVNKLEEQVSSTDEVIAELQEQIDTLKAEKILESFKEKMTGTEFDRFVQLTESVKFKDETQYAKQLSIVLENFGKIAAKKVEQTEQIVEEVAAPVAQPIVTESFSSVNRYAQYLAKK
jgi:hypothetical protein